MNSKTPIIGLCGGVGAGKTTVANEFATLGALVISSDQLNHDVLSDPAVAAELASWWGPEVLNADGAVDRSAVARRVFDNPNERKRLESLVHPLIAQRRADMIQHGIADPAVKAIILDSPLLFESDLDRRCDVVIYIEAERDLRLQRVQRTRGWNQQELNRRERWQLTPAEKRSRAKFVIDNSSSREQLAARVHSLFRDIVGGM